MVIRSLVRVADFTFELVHEFCSVRAPIPTAIALVALRRSKALLTESLAKLERQAEDPEDDLDLPPPAAPVVLTPAAVAMRYEPKPPEPPPSTPPLAGSVAARLEAIRNR